MEERKLQFGTYTERDIIDAMMVCMEQSDDGFLFVDKDGKIVYINPAYGKYIGVDTKRAVGMFVNDCIYNSTMAKVAANVDHVPEINVFHKASDTQFRDKEQYVIVNRFNVSRDRKSIGAVAQVKFVRNTLKLSGALNDIYTQLEYYKKEMGRLAVERYSFEHILGTSAQLAQVKEVAKRAASNDFSVLITGETGTGKEVFANAVHYGSNRKTKPFIRINCAAIPAELMESELFGYMEGSFTGAKRGGKKGKFELADGGTIFLDEIGEMPLYMQAKILRALQEREIERVGGDKPIPVNIRIIAATNRNLQKEVEEKRFREDLYYRLNVIDIKIPPLRQRKEDICLYIESFLEEINHKYHTEIYMDDEAREILMGYNWPGNVRELKNTIERCYALSEKGVITRFTIPQSIIGALKFGEVLSNRKNRLDEIMNEVEREIIVDEIKKTKGNLRQTAVNLGIHRTTLYKKMDKLGISREDATGDTLA